jgi:hypothetical protein
MTDLDFATSGTDEDGTRWVTSGGPEHLTGIRDRAVRALEALPRGGVPTAVQASDARTNVRLVIIDLESALGLEDDERYQDNSPLVRAAEQP